MGKIQSIRGMHDALPAQAYVWRLIENGARELLEGYGYSEIRLPILEKTELFKRSIGEVTDIVEKEMYTFKDVGDDWLSLRPEGTSGCARACLQHGLISRGQQQRFWYGGPFFRRERPQKERYRQFYQIGAETFGFTGPDIDAELMIMANFLVTCQLPTTGRFSLEINTLGNPASRLRYRKVLVDYLRRHEKVLSEAARKRMLTNPLRVLDSKDAATQAAVRDAPKISDYLDDFSLRHFARLQMLLRKAGVVYTVNPALVRGLDYYSHGVFELIATDASGSSYTVCAGGRYDGLVEQLGGPSVPAAGFALGVERLAAHLKQQLFTPRPADIYIAAVGREAEDYVQVFAARLREKIFRAERKEPVLVRVQCQGDSGEKSLREQSVRQPRIVVNADGGKIRTQLRKADKLGAVVTMILGDEEIANKTVTVKFMQAAREQECVAADDVYRHLCKWRTAGIW